VLEQLRKLKDCVHFQRTANEDTACNSRHLKSVDKCREIHRLGEIVSKEKMAIHAQMKLSRVGIILYVYLKSHAE
jgi:hypothetical protein